MESLKIKLLISLNVWFLIKQATNPYSKSIAYEINYFDSWNYDYVNFDILFALSHQSL